MAAKQIDILLAGLMDLNGDPINGGKVETYEAGTSTPKNTWTDYDKSTVAANPIILDSAGRSLRFGEGLYKFIVKDASDAVLYTWDNLDINLLATSHYAGNASGTATDLILNGVENFILKTGTIISFNLLTSTNANTTLNINSTGSYLIKNKINNANLVNGELLGFVVVQFLGDRYKVLSSQGGLALSASYVGDGSLTFTPSSEEVFAKLIDNSFNLILRAEGTTVNSGAHIDVSFTGIPVLSSFLPSLEQAPITAFTRNATSGAILPARAFFGTDASSSFRVFTPAGDNWTAGTGRVIQFNLNALRT